MLARTPSYKVQTKVQRIQPSRASVAHQRPTSVRVSKQAVSSIHSQNRSVSTFANKNVASIGKQVLQTTMFSKTYHHTNLWRQYCNATTAEASKPAEGDVPKPPETVESKPAEEEAKATATADSTTTSSSTESASAKTESKEKAPKSNEKVVGPKDKHEFQAETRKILDIVARSLYTDREVFIRELISNASDALEKYRHLTLTNQLADDPNIPLEVNVYTDPVKKTITIQDTGIGMTKEELVKNLGSIGHSGSLEFVKDLKDKQVRDIIGQFGVGFYSAFMVSSNVTVYSRSGKSADAKGYQWTSDGSGSYEISEAEGVERGTKIIVELNEKSTEFSQKETVEKIIKKYSNFVGFKINLNGQQVNTVKALWTLNKNQISAQDHKEFYQFVAHAYDEPLLHLHYATDSPLNIRALFYIGNHHSEKWGMGRMESGINLFSKKVLIQAKAKNILPDYLRFIKGVVDSEDIPLNISREHMQDNGLIQKISNVLTKKVLKWLDEEASKETKKYTKFWHEFGNFIREGLCTDITYKEELAKLLRCESSATEEGKLTSLDDYISRMDKEQKEIYYLCVPNRSLALSSPYYEAFKANNKEVLFLYASIDDFVMTHLDEYKKYKLISIESTKAAPKTAAKDEKEPVEQLTKEQIKEFSKWMKETLTGKVSSVKATDRLTDTPAIIVDHESGSFRRMMKYVDPEHAPSLPKQQVEINPKHPVILGVNALRTEAPEKAKIIIEQVFDNALVTAGLVDDARSMVPRITRLLSLALGKELPKGPEEPPASKAAKDEEEDESVEEEEKDEEKKETEEKK